GAVQDRTGSGAERWLHPHAGQCSGQRVVQAWSGNGSSTAVTDNLLKFHLTLLQLSSPAQAGHFFVTCLKITALGDTALKMVSKCSCTVVYTPLLKPFSPCLTYARIILRLVPVQVLSLSALG